MKSLNGGELAGFVKERQAKQVRALRQSWRVIPKLVLVQSKDDPVIDTYVRLKQNYAADILVESELVKVDQASVIAKIQELNQDESVHGIIVQLPLADMSVADEVVAQIDPNKDVDGLAGKGEFISATATAIDWLLAGYNVNLVGKKIAIVGHGRLVGRPLAKLWRDAGHDIEIFDENSTDMGVRLIEFDVIVSAVGVPSLIKSSMVKNGATVVDAGTASEGGVIKGDVDPEVRQRQDITITPEKGGVGPLTIAALLDNVITAARHVADQQGQKDL